MPVNKCDLCALKVIFDQSAFEKARNIEDYFETLRELQKSKIINKGYNRRIFTSVGTSGEGDKSEMCAINSRFFLPENNDKKCPEFILNMNLSTAEALSLNLSDKTVKLTAKINIFTVIILILTFISAIVGFCSLMK